MSLTILRVLRGKGSIAHDQQVFRGLLQLPGSLSVLGHVGDDRQAHLLPGLVGRPHHQPPAQQRREGPGERDFVSIIQHIGSNVTFSLALPSSR
jgi:hypothetical protein